MNVECIKDFWHLHALGEDGEPGPLNAEGEVKKQRKRQARKKSQLENSFPNYLQVHHYELISIHLHMETKPFLQVIIVVKFSSTLFNVPFYFHDNVGSLFR